MIDASLQTNAEIIERKKEKVKSLSCVWLFAIPWTEAHQAPLSMEFSRPEYWSGLPFPSPGDLPNPGIEPGSLNMAGRIFTDRATREDHFCFKSHLYLILCSWHWDSVLFSISLIIWDLFSCLLASFFWTALLSSVLRVQMIPLVASIHPATV